MENLRQFSGSIKSLDSVNDLKDLAKNSFNTFKVYPDSINFKNGSLFFIAKISSGKILAVLGQSDAFNKLEGKETTLGSFKAKICELSDKNCSVIMNEFPFTKPSNHKGIEKSFGLGDRLGLASVGHLRLVKGLPVFPVLAQQSVREITLTARSFEGVLSAAAWSVFQEGYTSGYGADGDHLKLAEDVKKAISCGYTMITLDCSEHIDNNAANLSASEVDAKYNALPQAVRTKLESKYLEKEFKLKDGSKIFFSKDDFKKIVLVYNNAVTFAVDIYNNIIKASGKSIDFEMSIDETSTPTTAESHYFVASELIDANVEVISLAPRFVGEFQKGIDYKGDIKEFEREFIIHVSISEHFGYKLSVHSGSDKFSVFPIVGEKTGGKWHVKTAGTNWLEAIKVIIAKNPALYRRMHKFAVANINEAKKYYHITTDMSKVPDVDTLTDAQLPALMDQDDPRQVIHVTYGLILQAKNADGSSTFRDEIYLDLDKYEEEYVEVLKKHIGKHLRLLGVMK